MLCYIWVKFCRLVCLWLSLFVKSVSIRRSSKVWVTASSLRWLFKVLVLGFLVLMVRIMKLVGCLWRRSVVVRNS